ncbi:MAG: hypothetical protein WA160_06010 [Pseudobdellovibrio sp.]
MKTLLKLIILISFIHLNAYAEEGASRGSRFNLSKSAEKRSLKRFTLKEWMEGKEKRDMMDMWLSVNTPSPYEFYLSGSLNQYSFDSTTNNISTQTTKKSYEGSFAAYATMVGLTAEYQNNTEENFNDMTAMFNLRLFGNTLQGTHLTVHYGLRTRTDNGGQYRLNQSFPAVTLQVYLTKNFGLQGHYRYYLPITESYYGDTQANDYAAGAFIDFDAFRIFGDYYQEKQNSKLNAIDSSLIRTGTKIGLRIYF